MNNARAETTWLDGDGLRLAATAYGDPSAPPIIFLHGGGQTRHAWGTAGEAFAGEGLYALSVDLRGHGESEWSSDSDYTMDAFASDVAALCESQTAPPVLVGASLGGLASLVAAGTSEDPIAAGLVLVDVAPRIEQQGTDKIRAFMHSGMDGFDELEDVADAISAFLPHRPRPADLSGLKKNLRQRDGRWYWHWDPAFISGGTGVDGQDGFARHDRLAAAARNVEVPTLLVWGLLSEIVSEESVAEFRDLVPHAEVAEVAGAAHMVAGDKNDAFNATVLDFVRRIVLSP